MPGITGVYGMLGRSGEAMGAAMKAGKRFMLKGVGGASRRSLAPMFSDFGHLTHFAQAQVLTTTMRSPIATGIRMGKAALRRGVNIGGRQLRMTGTQLGQVR